MVLAAIAAATADLTSATDELVSKASSPEILVIAMRTWVLCAASDFFVLIFLSYRQKPPLDSRK